MKILLDNKESEEYFYNALCNGADWLGGYGITIDYTNEASDKARKNFKNNNPDKVSETDAEWLLQMKNEEDDAITADCILQTVIFGEVVYG
jgi:hypothetical protein